MSYFELMLDVEIWLGFYMFGVVSGILVFWIEQQVRQRDE